MSLHHDDDNVTNSSTGDATFSFVQREEF